MNHWNVADQSNYLTKNVKFKSNNQSTIFPNPRIRQNEEQHSEHHERVKRTLSSRKIFSRKQISFPKCSCDFRSTSFVVHCQSICHQSLQTDMVRPQRFSTSILITAGVYLRCFVQFHDMVHFSFFEQRILNKSEPKFSHAL
jgi:hypothetical protein